MTASQTQRLISLNKIKMNVNIKGDREMYLQQKCMDILKEMNYCIFTSQTLSNLSTDTYLFQLTNIIFNIRYKETNSLDTKSLGFFAQKYGKK